MAESAFSSIKGRLGEHIRAKKLQNMFQEVRLKVFMYNWPIRGLPMAHARSDQGAGANLLRIRDNQVSHPENEHDDQLWSLALALYVAKEDLTGRKPNPIIVFSGQTSKNRWPELDRPGVRIILEVSSTDRLRDGGF